MIKIVKADDKGNITLTEDELNTLLKEAYNEGYDKGYEWGKQIDINKWVYKNPKITWTYKPTTTTGESNSNLDTYKLHSWDSLENGIPQ